MLKLFFLNITIILAVVCMAQDSGTKVAPPSIKTLSKQISDSIKLRRMMALAYEFSFERSTSKKDLDSAFILLQQAQKFSDEINLSQWQPEIFCYLGKYYYKTGSIEMANLYFNQTIEYIKKLGTVSQQIKRWKQLAWRMPVLDSAGLTRINCFSIMQSLYKQLHDSEKVIEMQREIADTYMKQGKVDIAGKELLNVLANYKAIHFKNLHYTYNLLSVTERLKGNYDKSLNYALLAIKSMQQTNDTARALDYYSNVAQLHDELGQTDKSIEYYNIFFSLPVPNPVDFYYVREAGVFTRDLIKQNRKDEAYNFLTKFTKKHPAADVYSKAVIARTFAYYYNAIHNGDLAEKYMQQLISLEKYLAKNNEVRRDVESDIGQYYYDKSKFLQAAGHFNIALDEATVNNSVNSIKDINLMLFKVDSARGNYVEAIKHLNRYRQLNDSIFTEAKIKQVEELQLKYETAKKEQNIKQLESENKIQQSELSKATLSRNWTIGGSILLIAILALLSRNITLKQRTNKALKEQQAEIEGRNVILNHLVDEKEWLLKEVHHRVKNNMQMIISLLNSQSAYIENEPALAAIKNSQNRVQAMSLIHQKLYNTNNLAEVDLSFYIRELVSYLADSFNAWQHIRFEYNIQPLKVNVTQAVPLGLILNEAITNAIKYAFPGCKSGTISISLLENAAHNYELIIADNGVGLPANFNNKNIDSLGMSLMAGLSEDIDGHFSIENNNGTLIRVSFALET